ncbi:MULTISPECIES: YlbF family regulator [unclassified Granulicatella]|uniref:YlbF family regulator n=1 Tax=unclassified Granulicatella TaxID=2630493 RepID=UPI001073490F|nr:MULTISPECIES: YlbF family regulator [unclassified Granulicatella]MBF0779907.1 YlbF family regulator [Granulicatella sp. 19428wC4_WM01]TFU96018.1 hypothetical protein E4T68_02245 [Granulicatella sp. WM01]
MAQQLYDIANNMERELRKSKEYQALKEAFEQVHNNAEAKKEFEAFKAITMKFQEMQMSGKQPSEKDIEEAQQGALKAQENELIVSLMKAEQAMSVLMEDLNKIITQPLADIYNN